MGIGASEGLEHIGARLQGRQGGQGVGKALLQFGLQAGQQGLGLGGRALPEPGLEIHRLLQRPPTQAQVEPAAAKAQVVALAARPGAEQLQGCREHGLQLPPGHIHVPERFDHGVSG